MKGYWRREDATAEAMTDDGYFCTGDIAVMDASGFFRIVDRKKDMIIVSGFNVFPNEIEAEVAAMGEVLTDQLLDQINSRGDQLRINLNKIAREHGTCIQFTGLGSLLGMHTTPSPIHSTADLKDSDDRIMELIFLDLLEKGYYIARRGFIALMLPIGDTEIEGFRNAFSAVVKARGELLN